jgi:hypothetical protein
MVAMSFVFMNATQEIDAQTPDLANPEAVITTETPAESPTTQTQPVRTGISADEQFTLDLAEVKRSYRGQLAEYRTLHQQFVVARQEFQQLGTLSSLEAAVQATQKVLVMRDTVLLSYLKTLEYETRLAEALEPELKESSLFVLSETQKSITRHLEDTQASSDRAAVQRRAVEFESIEELYAFTVGFSKQLLQLGKLRSSQQLAENILADLPIELATQNELQKAVRRRSLDQITQGLEGSNASLDEVELVLEESLADASIENTSDLFEEVYAILQRVTGFLDEVHVPTTNQ